MTEGYEQRRVAYPIVDGIAFPSGFLRCHGCQREVRIGQPYREVAVSPVGADGSRVYELRCVYCDDSEKGGGQSIEAVRKWAESGHTTTARYGAEEE